VDSLSVVNVFEISEELTFSLVNSELG